MIERSEDRIRHLVEENMIVVFLKGTPRFPMCGDSAEMIELLSELGMTYEAIDVLTDLEARDGVRRYSGDAALPQVYVDGNRVDGPAELKELHASGRLERLAPSITTKHASAGL